MSWDRFCLGDECFRCQSTMPRDCDRVEVMWHSSCQENDAWDDLSVCADASGMSESFSGCGVSLPGDLKKSLRTIRFDVRKLRTIWVVLYLRYCFPVRRKRDEASPKDNWCSVITIPTVTAECVSFPMLLDMWLTAGMDFLGFTTNYRVVCSPVCSACHASSASSNINLSSLPDE